MKDYLRRVSRCLHLPRQKKREVLRDLEEMFASAREHGEEDAVLLSRLGTPEAYARSVETQLGLDPARQKRRNLLFFVLGLAVAAGAFGLWQRAQALRASVPQGVIGQADAATDIQLVGSFDLLLLAPVLGAAALAFALWQLTRLLRANRPAE